VLGQIRVHYIAVASQSSLCTLEWFREHLRDKTGNSERPLTASGLRDHHPSHRLRFMGKRPAPDPDNCLGGSFPPLVNCAVGAHYEISFVLLLGERSRFSRILKKLLISSARCLSQAECRPEITRLASNIRSGEPFGLFVRARGRSVLWQPCRGACGVVRLNRLRWRLRPQLDNIDGHCAHRPKSYQRVREVPFLSSAAHVELWPYRFRGTICT